MSRHSSLRTMPRLISRSARTQMKRQPGSDRTSARDLRSASRKAGLRSSKRFAIRAVCVVPLAGSNGGSGSTPSKSPLNGIDAPDYHNHLHLPAHPGPRVEHTADVRVEDRWSNAGSGADACADQPFTIKGVRATDRCFGARSDHHLNDLSAEIKLGEGMARFIEC